MSDTTKILVISDVHGRLRELRWVLQNETGVDALFFLGDGLYDLDNALQMRKTPVPYPVYRVAGNCDNGYTDPAEGLAPFAGVLFFYTHGQNYQVKWTLSELTDTAQARGADVALFGHTHHNQLVPGLGVRPDLFNPGSLGMERCYGVIEVENGQCRYNWKRVPEI